MRKKRRRIFRLVSLSILFLCIVGVLYRRPYIGVPSKPSDLSILFKYGVGAQNVLNTNTSSFTKDMIIDDDITVSFKLSDYDMHRIWASLHRHNFYGLEEQVVGPASNYYSPISTFTLSVRASGYPNRTMTMVGPNLVYHSDSEDAFFMMVKSIRLIIESQQAYKVLPKVRGSYS